MFKQIKLFLLLSLFGILSFNCLGLTGQPVVSSGTGINVSPSTNQLTGVITYTTSISTNVTAITATNDAFNYLIGGSNAPVSIVGNTGFQVDFSNYTPTIAGEIGIAPAGTGGEDFLVSYATTTKGDFKHGFGFPSGISQIGDPQIMDPNVNSINLYVNGNPTVQTTNNTGDGLVNAINMDVYGSGSGFNCAIVTNDASGVPHVNSLNSASFMHVDTNSYAGFNKTNVFGGYHAIIANYSSRNMGLLIGGPHGGTPGDTGIPNKYILGVLGVDSTGTFKGQVRIPHIIGGVSTPDDPNDVDIFLADANLGTLMVSNVNILSGTANGPFTINNGATIVATNGTFNGTFNASSTSAAQTLNSTNVNIGTGGTANLGKVSASAFRADGAGGQPITGPLSFDISNGSGSGFNWTGNANSPNFDFQCVSGGVISWHIPSGGAFFEIDKTTHSLSNILSSSFTSTNASSFPTNTANYSVNTNDLVPGAINTGPANRFDVTMNVFGTATLATPFYAALIYSNAVDGQIYTVDSWSIPAGILAANTVTNSLKLIDAQPNSLFWLTNTAQGQSISVVKNNSTRIITK